MFRSYYWKYALKEFNCCSIKCLVLWFCCFLIVHAITIPGEDNKQKAFNVNVASDDEIKECLRQYGVHYNVKSILDVLKLPENKKEDTIYVLLVKYEEIRQKAPVYLPEKKHRHPIISIDGFFTHGRTKVAKMVASALYGRRILLPTRHVSRLRTYFRDVMIKKHYYSLSKYMGAHLAMSYCRSAPVILERYWHDQATYVMAKSFETLIPENSSVYEFPKDLLVPDVMFFVNGALNQQIHNETTAVLHSHNELSQRIVEVYKRMRKPKLIEIGPPGLPKPMVSKILNHMKSIQQNFMPKPLTRPFWRN